MDSVARLGVGIIEILIEVPKAMPWLAAVNGGFGTMLMLHDSVAIRAGGFVAHFAFGGMFVDAEMTFV